MQLRRLTIDLSQRGLRVQVGVEIPGSCLRDPRLHMAPLADGSSGAGQNPPEELGRLSACRWLLRKVPLTFLLIEQVKVLDPAELLASLV